MIKNKVIISPLYLNWERSADFQRQTLNILKEKNEVVVYDYFNSTFFLKFKPSVHIKKNIFFYKPVYFLPFKRFSFIRRFNEYISLFLLLIKKNNKTVILWIFDPYFHYFSFLSFFFKNLTIIYDCVDYHSHKNKLVNINIKKNESSLIKKADFFFVNSKQLKKIHRGKKLKSFLVPQGFKYQSFIKNKVVINNKKIIGLVGSIDYRINLDILLFLAKLTEKHAFELAIIGKIHPNLLKLKKIKKILNHPMVTHKVVKSENIANEINSFSIGIIPYLNLPITNNSYPMKLMEYFYLGKPVISSPIFELKRFSKLVEIAETKEDWEDKIIELLSYSWPKKLKKIQKKIALNNTWEKKIEKISSYL